MALAAGTKVGSYEVVAQIGAGGMGEVYQTHDTKLGRDVAIKVLPEAFAHDPERLSRFQREAKMLAALNHPNIATIHGLEQSGGTSYLVMELVSGETLAERMRSGPLPIEDALKISVQIAEALEAAHEKNIIHRDLKPANVKVTPEGKVKVLDFGLAKAFEGDSANEDMSNSPTLSRAATMQGVILGTAAYMSPEQARGKSVDKRTDIWAFGCVLYELLTGKQAFHGEDITDILAAVVKAEPDWQALPAATPVMIRNLLRRCMQKDKTLRMQAAGDARIEIQEALTSPSDDGAERVGVLLRTKLSWSIAVTLAIVATLALWAWWHATSASERAPRPLVRLSVDLGPDVSLGSVAGSDVIVSPDGTRLVYVSQNRLFTRRLDQSTGTELTGTEGAYEPFFSPDGQWVAFFTGSQLKKVPVEGGGAILLCDCSAGVSRGGSWGEDGNIIASLSSVRGGLSRIPSAGGTPTPITQLAPGEAIHSWPQILPGGKAVMFTTSISVVGFDSGNIEVMSLEDRHRKTVQRGSSYGRYLPSGHLVYMNRGTLFAVPFDLDRLEELGTPVPLLQDVAYSPNNGFAQFEFSSMSSAPGTLVYRSGGAGESGLVTLEWLDSAGKMQPLLPKPGFYQRPRISPDGERVALEISDVSGSDIWVYEWRRDTMTRLTSGGAGTYINPTWSPDGRYILFSGTPPDGIFWTRSDGATKPQPLTQSANLQVPFSFTSDGKRLSFNEAAPGSQYDLWTVTVERDAVGLHADKPEPFLLTPFDEREPVLSPDGRWLAYTANDSGTFQVYVRAFPDRGGKWQISNNGGSYPEWSRNGHELFFRSTDNRIMVASYTVRGDSFAADRPRVWSEKRLADFGPVGIRSYDLAPDGKRIIALISPGTLQAQAAQNHVIFLENFFDELRRRVPTGKRPHP